MKLNCALGFTLVELMVTVSMMAIVLALGVPAFKDTVRNSNLISSINMFIASLTYARSEAVKNGVYVTVRKTSSSDAVGWEGGWQVFTDVDGNGVFDSATDQVLRTYPPLKTNLTLRGNGTILPTRISFKPSGESNTFGSFALCDTSVAGNPTSRSSRFLVVSILGRLSLVQDTDTDGSFEKSDGSHYTSCTSP